MTALWADLSKFVKSPFWRYISALGALWHSCATGSWTGKGENQALDRPRLLSGRLAATIYGHINILHTQPAIMPLK